ncbi:WD40 repeat-like protein [Corynespora cassiicola Philippines]|uniref:WD40 repeat-like protein n=1 Tax=Corynespora cassiicola Philippines TaxID=1448308 RepID=A0A2T2NHP6_CORCC|nr:WD40 repeat-like protein [Corynespora cassiicola Philippines]
MSMRIYSLVPSEIEEDLVQAELLRSLRPHTSPVVTLAIDATGTLVATGCADGVVKVWDIRAGYTTHTFHAHRGVVSALHFFQIEITESQNNKKRKRSTSKRTDDSDNEAERGEKSLEFRLASGAEDGKVKVWNLHKQEKPSDLDSHVSVVRSLSFSPQQNMLLSGSRDKTLILWDAKTWKPKRTLPALEGIESAGFVADSQAIFSGGENGRIRLWSTETGRELTEEQEPGNETDAIVDVLYYSGLPYLVSVHADQILNFHSLDAVSLPLVEETLKPLPIFRQVSGTHDEVIDLAYVGSDKSLLALNTNSEDLRIITLKSSQSPSAQATDAKYFGADVAFLRGHEDIVICLDVDWSGHWLVTGAKDNTARLWRLDPENNSFTCASVLTGHAESLGAIALPHTAPPESSAAYTDPLSHPPAYVVTGSQDRTVKRWDIGREVKQKLRAKYTRKAHDKDINAIDIDPSGNLFASASQDRTVKIYSASEGEAIGVLRGHRRGVWTVKFAPKDSQPPNSGNKGLIATGSGDKTVKIWSLADYSCLLTLEGHSNSVLKLAWLPYRPVDARDKRGPQVASAAGDGLVKIWDSVSGEAMSTLDNHTDRVWALTSHPTTGALISGGGDSVITFWKDTTNATLEAATSAETERVELDQKLQNYAYSGNYREAITLALQMDQPGRLFTLFKSVVETDTPDEDSMSGLMAVDEVLANLADEQLYKLLLRLRDWNTNVRSAPVAQKILWTVVKSYPAARLSSLRPAGKVGAKGSLKDILDAIKAYSERHYKRVEELIDESYLLDFTLREMDEVGDVRAITNGTSKLGVKGDVVMAE